MIYAVLNTCDHAVLNTKVGPLHHPTLKCANIIVFIQNTFFFFFLNKEIVETLILPGKFSHEHENNVEQL